MANQRLDPVSYKPLRVNPVLSEGLLSVARDNGDLERRVAVGLARMADSFGETADRQAQRAGALAGARDAAAGAPGQATVSGGQTIGTVSATATAGSGIRVSPKAGNTAAAYARDYLAKKHGLSPIAAAAIAGHGMQESGFADDVITGTRTGDNGTAFGVFQWRGDRLTNLKAFAGKSGADWRSLDTQLDYTVHELNTTEKTAGNALAGARDLDEAVAAFMHFERPQGYTAQDPRGGHAFGSRLAYAQALAGRNSASNSVAGADQPSYAKIPASSVAPISVTPMVEPVAVTPGEAGKFRPSGSDTIRGRAYDVAGTRTYLEELDLTMRSDQAAVYDAYKDDPVQLEKALGELKTAHMRESVFDEIAPDYDMAFRRSAMTLVDRAKSEKLQTEKAAERVGFLNRVSDYEDKKAQTLAGINPRDPEGAVALAELQGSIDAHYDSAVARGILSPGEAEQAKRESRSEGTVGFYVKQAANLRPDEIAAMRGEMTKDFAAGNLEGVTAGDWDKINSGLVAAENARKTQDSQANRSLSVRGNDLAKRIASGQPVSAEELARFQIDAGTAPNGGQIVKSTLSRMRVSDAIRKMPIGEVEKKQSKLLAGEGESARPDDIDFARKAIDKQKKDLAADPLGVAERFGVLPITEPLPIGQGITVDQAQSAFDARMASADAAAEHFGVTPKYFRPEEAAQIKMLMQTDPDAALSIAAGVVSSAGPKATRILGELGDNAPGMEQAGTIIVLGGDANAARDLLAGYGKTPDGKSYPDVPIAKQRPVSSDLFGTALAFDQAMARKLENGAAAIARKRLYDAGIDPKSSDAKPVFERALNEAAGATFAGEVQFGGFASFDPGFRWSARQVVVPANVRADRFEDVVGAITDADLGGVSGKNGKPWRAQDFQSAMPVRVDGGHVFALGDPSSGSPMFISDASGHPIVLDFEGDIGKRLASRVPEAFR